MPRRPRGARRRSGRRRRGRGCREFRRCDVLSSRERIRRRHAAGREGFGGLQVRGGPHQTASRAFARAKAPFPRPRASLFQRSEFHTSVAVRGGTGWRAGRAPTGNRGRHRPPRLAPETPVAPVSAQRESIFLRRRVGGFALLVAHRNGSITPPSLRFPGGVRHDTGARSGCRGHLRIRSRRRAAQRRRRDRPRLPPRRLRLCFRLRVLAAVQ